LMPEPQTLLTGVVFGESPRWGHDDRLWFADWGAQQVVAVDPEGNSQVMVQVDFPSFPMSIDWLPDGRLLVVSGRDGLLLRREPDGSLVTHADLTGLAQKGPPWNEIVVDGRGNAYINNQGFEFPGGEFAPGTIALLTPDGSARQVADGIAFPNGMAVTPDNQTLIVAESYANKLTAFEIAADGSLSGRRAWANLGGDTPDGICIDAEGAAGTPTSPTSIACGSARAARCCRRSSWTVAASPACLGARTKGRCSWWPGPGMGWKPWPTGSEPARS
jgi:sugar lactone lactonase YvrE